MSYLHELASALGLRNRASASFIESFSDSLVDDNTGRPALRTVLLLESPYEVELSHKHPLASDSGMAVTQKLLRNCNVPIGCLLYQGPQCPRRNIDHPLLDRLGLMNVSRLPLCGDVYDAGVRNRYSTFLGHLRKIRKSPFATPRDNVRSKICKAIRDDLRRRLQILSNDVVIVPCGGVARAFLSRSKYDVPHPSRKQWGRDIHSEEVNRLVDGICNGPVL